MKFDNLIVPVPQNFYIPPTTTDKTQDLSQTIDFFGTDILGVTLDIQNTLFFGHPASLNHPTDQNMEYKQNRRGSAEKWYTWQIMHQYHYNNIVLTKIIICVDNRSMFQKNLHCICVSKISFCL